MKAIITLCEGPHDVEFLYKILRPQGFKSYGKTVENLPNLLKQYVLATFEGFNFEEKNLYQRPTLPTVVYHAADDIFLLFYALGGDGKIEEAKSVITAFQDLLIAPQVAQFGRNKFVLSFIYDADDKGIESRTNNIKTNFSTLLPELELLTHNNLINGNEFKKIGAYIFANEAGIGKLEDIVLPLMKIDNEAIFEEATNYLSTHFDQTRFSRARDMRKYYDVKKSTIGIAGQLQRSGRNNTVIIRDSDYITPAKISNHATCQEIISFFNALKNSLH